MSRHGNGSMAPLSAQVSAPVSAVSVLAPTHQGRRCKAIPAKDLRARASAGPVGAVRRLGPQGRSRAGLRAKGERPPRFRRSLTRRSCAGPALGGRSPFARALSLSRSRASRERRLIWKGRSAARNNAALSGRSCYLRAHVPPSVLLFGTLLMWPSWIDNELKDALGRATGGCSMTARRATGEGLRLGSEASERDVVDKCSGGSGQIDRRTIQSRGHSRRRERSATKAIVEVIVCLLAREFIRRRTDRANYTHLARPRGTCLINQSEPRLFLSSNRGGRSRQLAPPAISLLHARSVASLKPRF